MRKFSADYIFPVSSDPITDGVVAVDDDGTIIGLYARDSLLIPEGAVENLKGIIVPGFVNSHCHLELSHLKNKIAKDQTLIPFIKEVIEKRYSVTEDYEAAMRDADTTMTQNGIVAVGDISNTDVSINTKASSTIHYHTYVEVFCFNPEKVTETLNKGIELKRKFEPLPVSIVPHAPYSVCKDLFKKIFALENTEENFLSIHNQESDEENKFYCDKSGDFVEFYKDLKYDIEFFKPQASSSIQSIVPLMRDRQRIMLVHNTYTSQKDLYFVRRFNKDITWCFCPNANFFIERRLPKIDMFLKNDFNITLGTDSLASNDELCILSELKAVHAHDPGLSFTKTIAWATLNGARFLSIDDRFGSIEKGKRPGLNLISDTIGLELSKKSSVKKLI